jgi:hypothetical protein
MIPNSVVVRRRALPIGRPMSMLARFVQVPPDDLAALRDDPSAVADLFDGELGAPAPGLALSPEARERREQRAPQVLSQALAALDPAVQEALARRLGVDTAALGTEEGGSAIVQLMQRRGLIDDEPAEPEDPPSGGHPTLSLEKAWHGVHYLLCGQPEPTTGGLGSLILGGTEVGDDEFGYGPARFFSADEVEELAAEIGRDALEDEVAGRYEPERMTSLGIYPGGWESTDSEWLLEAFRELRDFFQDATSRGCAVVTCLV